MRHVLIVKISSLGDIIHAFPVLNYLKQIYPLVEIDWVVEESFAELVQAHPLVHRVLLVQTKKWRAQFLTKTTWQELVHIRRELRKTCYDIVLDLQGNVKSGIVTAFTKSPLKVGFGYSTVPEWPNLLATHRHYNPPADQNIREDYLFIAQSACANFTPVQVSGVQLKLTLQEKVQLQPVLEDFQKMKSLKVMICSGSHWSNKQLSKETLLSFLRIFSAQFHVHFLFIWGQQTEKEMAEELVLALPQQSSVMGKLSLPSLQHLMAQVDLVLAMDSLPLHLAGTTSTPTYSVFGASSAQKYQPLGEHHEAFQGSCPYGKKFEKRCELLRTCKTGACMKELKGKQLFGHFFAWWSSLKVEGKLLS